MFKIEACTAWLDIKLFAMFIIPTSISYYSALQDIQSPGSPRYNGAMPFSTRRESQPREYIYLFA